MAIAIAPLAMGVCLDAAEAQRPPGIQSISICSPVNTGNLQQGSCGFFGMFDTQQPVGGPKGAVSVNHGGGLGVEPAPDEHSTVFAPGTLGSNAEYLFFLASTEGGFPGIGMAVLSGGTGPVNGIWTLNFPSVDGYGAYSTIPGQVFFGQVFNHPTTDSICPTVPDGNVKHQNETFDMHYAAGGSVVIDPTGPPGSVLMVYEGANSCIGNPGVPGQPTGPATSNSYISLAIATSLDYGKTWPTYRGTPTFEFFQMPAINPTQAPHSSHGTSGALGSDVCMGNDCITIPPASYGRYPVVTPPMSLDSLMKGGAPLMQKYGEQEISGFVDDVGGNPMPYIYVNSGDVRVAQAQLNGGTAPLQFSKWTGTRFNSPGLGGTEISVLPQGAFANCEDPSQNQYGSSISYVDATRQYLLTFLCVSQGDPNPPNGEPPSAAKGAAWFYSTSYDLTDQSKWSTPSEIQGSWNQFDPNIQCSNGPYTYYNGYYPSFMSLNKSPGHLSLTGYVFYLTGCQGGTPGGRTFTTRAFTITQASPPAQ